MKISIRSVCVTDVYCITEGVNKCMQQQQFVLVVGEEVEGRGGRSGSRRMEGGRFSSSTLHCNLSGLREERRERGQRTNNDRRQL